MLWIFWARFENLYMKLRATPDLICSNISRTLGRTRPTDRPAARSAAKIFGRDVSDRPTLFSPNSRVGRVRPTDPPGGGVRDARTEINFGPPYIYSWKLAPIHPPA